MKRIDPLGFLILAITFITALTMFFTSGASAEGSIAVNLSGITGDNAWGVVGDYEKGIFEIEGNLQKGESYAGNIDASVTLFDYLRISSKNTLSGYSLNGLGRTNDLEGAFVFGLTDEVDVAVGISGRNGNPFARVYELEDPSDPNSAVLKDAGITVPEGSTLLASLEVELDVGRFKIEGQGLLEILGTDDKIQQARFNVATDGSLLDTGFTWHVGANARIQKYGELVEYVATYFAGIGKRFKGL